MPVYEYECQDCRKVFEVQQKMSDAPPACCPDCKGEVKKIVSMSSFQLKGGGWYADGYASKGTSSDKVEKEKPSVPAASKKDSGCKSCPAAATAK